MNIDNLQKHSQPDQVPSRYSIEKELVHQDLQYKPTNSFTLNYFEDAQEMTREFLERNPNFQTLQSRVFARKAALKKTFFTLDFIQKFPLPVGFALILLLGLSFITPKYLAEKLTTKSGASATLYLNSKEIDSTLEMEFKAGDTAQILVYNNNPVWYYIAYSDDGKELQSYIPKNLQGKTVLPQSKQPQTLPFSIILDSIPRIETIYCILSPDPISFSSAKKHILKSLKTERKKQKAVSVLEWRLIRK